MSICFQNNARNTRRAIYAGRKKRVSANVTIDYNVMDLDQFQEDQPSISSYIEDGKFLVSGIVEMYESFGATCE